MKLRFFNLILVWKAASMKWNRIYLVFFLHQRRSSFEWNKNITQNQLRVRLRDFQHISTIIRLKSHNLSCGILTISIFYVLCHDVTFFTLQNLVIETLFSLPSLRDRKELEGNYLLINLVSISSFENFVRLKQEWKGN